MLKTDSTWETGVFRYFLFAGAAFAAARFSSMAAFLDIDLHQVVGAEAQELGIHRYFIRGEGTAGDFDHGAHLVGESDFYSVITSGYTRNSS